jgi:hypothetical protein
VAKFAIITTRTIRSTMNPKTSRNGDAAWELRCPPDLAIKRLDGTESP